MIPLGNRSSEYLQEAVGAESELSEEPDKFLRSIENLKQFGFSSSKFFYISGIQPKQPQEGIMTANLTELLVSLGRKPEEYQVVIEALSNGCEVHTQWYKRKVLDVKKCGDTYFVLEVEEKWGTLPLSTAFNWRLSKFCDGSWSEVIKGEKKCVVFRQIKEIEKNETGWGITLSLQTEKSVVFPERTLKKVVQIS